MKKIQPSLRSNPISFSYLRIAPTYTDTFVKGSTVSNYQPVKPPKQVSEPQLFDIHIQSINQTIKRFFNIHNPTWRYSRV